MQPTSRALLAANVTRMHGGEAKQAEEGVQSAKKSAKDLP